MSWTIHEVVRTTGVTSRTLRHYDAIGLLPAGRSSGGVREYDDAALLRLQRILLLRDLGLGLEAIAAALPDPNAAPPEHLGTPSRETEALVHHLELLTAERVALDRRIAAVERTIEAREKGRPMTKDMFDGFDHTQYEEEVTARWGKQAYERSNAWWEGMTEQERGDWKSLAAQLNADWVAAARSGESPDGERGQEMAARHVRWLRSIPGTPAHGGSEEDLRGYVLGLAEMYADDERFAKNWTSDPLGEVPGGARFVRDALIAYVG
ncbi:MerR family transcriptional regulator [Serinibacter salmoneus]|uniref:DNA-binding transcriptional MerR regulator n=1 Tax=Serinibacter salmoneus TaxID=556530 RepID=A0A2A9D3X7_9MICO|nr:TipAS antibiotic-recognition domain-containing protein [Serinibacter salmoneus]PFG21046.1 DNA-binding transcriptional MerR regulator [Serinibacter salmoneus]